MKVIEILPDGNEIKDRLHPIYKYGFKNNIIGKTDMIRKVLLIINREPEAWAYLDKPLNAKNRKAIRQTSLIKIPYYWELIKLIATDRVLADKEIVNWMKDLDTETSFRIMNMIKKGVVKSYTPEKRYSRLNRIYKDIKDVIVDVFKDVDNVTELSKEEYKRLKNEVKERILNSIELKEGDNLLAGLVQDEHFDFNKFKEDYLK